MLFSKVGSDLVSGIQPQLLEYVADVGRNGMLGEHQLRGDLAVGEALGDENRYLLLAGGQGNRRLVVRRRL